MNTVKNLDFSKSSREALFVLKKLGTVASPNDRGHTTIKRELIVLKGNYAQETAN